MLCERKEFFFMFHSATVQNFQSLKQIFIKTCNHYMHEERVYHWRVGNVIG